MSLTVRPVATAADRRAFVDFQWQANKGDPHWVPPLKSEVHGLLDPKKNPWFGHAEAALFLAEREGRTVGRISAQVDRLVLDMPESQGGGAGTGHWGMLEAADEETAAALLARAEEWLRGRGMTRAMGPFSLSIWDEPGLLVHGHDHSPTVMMGHNSPAYQAWVEGAGYLGAKDLLTYELDITVPLPELVQRIIASGERNPRIRVRKVDKSRFAAEAALILSILNDAWSDNWGFVPLTDAEIAYAGKKLKPIVYEDLIRIAEYEGEPVAFMMTLPDLNELTRDLNGSLLPFGWAKLLWRLRKPRVRTMRVPLMG
ncbi:MAG TPA: N-acetyltransferase, partial [Allosphingosinicella sp.]|nr:N-acetyltransferase [Allosphingosinicella sp.]